MKIYPIVGPAGSDTEVQYNDGQVFGGDSTFNFNDVTKTLTVQELSVTNDAAVGNDLDVANDATVVATATVKRLLAGGVYY